MEGLPIDAANLLLDIHPLTVLLVTALGGIVGGIVGLILAVVQHMLR